MSDHSPSRRKQRRRAREILAEVRAERALARSHDSEPASSGDLNNTRWIPAGESVTIADHTITWGMIYVGDHLEDHDDARGSLGPDPSLILPHAPVSTRYRVFTDDDPRSYSLWNSSHRNQYLEWLESGRTETMDGDHMLTVFMWGLERRVYSTLLHADAEGEAALIEAEIYRLETRHSRMFSRYRPWSFVFRLLDVLDGTRMRSTVSGEDADPGSIPLPDYSQPDFFGTIRTSIAMGLYGATAHPIPPEWIAAMAVSHAITVYDDRAHRCKQEIHDLVMLRFPKRFPDGVIVPARQRLAPWPIASDNPALKNHQFDLSTIPELDNDSPEWQPVCELLDDVLHDLEPFMNATSPAGKFPDTMIRYLTLPTEMFDPTDNPVIQLQAWAKALLGEQQFVVAPAAEAIAFWSPSPTLRLTSAITTIIAETLEQSGIGMMPDPRFLGTDLRAAITMVLFRLPNHPPTEPSTAFPTAAALAAFAGMVIGADEPPMMEQVERAAQQVVQSIALSDVEIDYVTARLLWNANNAKGGRWLNLPASADQAQRLACFRWLYTLANDDGDISTNEAAKLRLIHELLRLEKD